MKAIVVSLGIAVLIATGCSTPRPQNSSIVGTWAEKDTGTLVRFNPDNTVQLMYGATTMSGTYFFEPPSSLVLRFDGNAPKPGPHKAVTKIEGKNMSVVWADGNSDTYTRVKR